MITKRLSAPRSYRIPRKVKKFVVSTMPGPHPRDSSIPLAVVLRDYLGLAETMREVRQILNTGKVGVDGITRKERKFPVGLMDVVSAGDQHFRVLIGKHGLYLKEISATEALKKPARIKRKTAVKGGRIQYTLHDGRNILGGNDYSRSSTLLISITDQKIIAYFEFKEGNIGYVIAGRKVGYLGVIEEIKITKSFMPNRVVLNADGEKIETIADYIFPIGKSKPCIDIGETNG